MSHCIPARLSLLLLLTAATWGQSFNTTVGGSQIYSAYGLQTEYKWRNFFGWTGIGYNDGPRFGAYLQAPLTKGSRIGIGDQILPGLLDVDEYDTHAFTVRGISVINKSGAGTWQVFSGLLTQESSYPYLHTGSITGSTLRETPLTAVLYQCKISPTLQLHSLMLKDSKLTSILSLGWKPSATWRFAGAAGVGAGARYFAATEEFHRERVDLRTSYTFVGRDFHRQEQSFYSTEPSGFNARLAVTPIPALKLGFDHERNRTYVASQSSVTSAIDSISVSAYLKGFQLSPSVSAVSNSNLPGHTYTEMFSASRRVLPRWRSFGAYIHMESPRLQQQTWVGINEVKISSRLSIRQNYNRTNGQNNFSFGAQWLSNRVSFSVDQQVYISPLAAAFGGKSIFQAWTFSVRFRAPHGTSTNVNTFVGPDGRLQWGGYLSGLRYNAVGPSNSNSPGFSKYIIRGTVVDEAGKGVGGIAIQIGDEIVLSDDTGEFFVHVKNTKPMPLKVVRDFSIQTRHWILNSAPSLAKGTLETAPNTPLLIKVYVARGAGSG